MHLRVNNERYVILDECLCGVSLRFLIKNQISSYQKFP